MEGLLSVKALDLTTGSENKVSIEGSSNLRENEVQKLVEEFEKNSEGDRVVLEQYRVRDKFLRVSAEVKKTIYSKNLKGDGKETAKYFMGEIWGALPQRHRRSRGKDLST